ncbi:MAG: LemA family protein [Flavobacteriales bacterium]
MKRSTIILLSVLGVLFILVMWVRSMYNGIIETEGTVDQKFADIQTQYQRRFDLIPQLVATVQMNAENEKEIITKVTQYRSGIADAKNAGDIEKMEPMARDIRTAINLQVEAYPNLKSPDAFRDLQAQLEGTENRIAKARSDYNEAVRGYNVRIKQFPTNMFNAMFGFEPRESFKADEGSNKAVDVREEFGKGKNAAE